MAAHARSLLAGVSVTVPIANGKLLLGTWQEFTCGNTAHMRIRDGCGNGYG